VDWTTSALMFASERFMAYALIRMGFQRAFRVTYRDRLIIRILDENTISHNLHDTAAMLADQRPQNYFAALPQRCTSRRGSLESYPQHAPLWIRGQWQRAVQ
jgi:hypothetical protein